MTKSQKQSHSHALPNEYGELRAGNLNGRFGFSGREQIASSNLYHYRSRNFDTFTGRFLEEDPIRYASFESNLFIYVKNSPLHGNDPTGTIAAFNYAFLALCGAGTAAALAIGAGPAFAYPINAIANSLSGYDVDSNIVLRQFQEALRDALEPNVCGVPFRLERN